MKDISFDKLYYGIAVLVLMALFLKLTDLVFGRIGRRHPASMAMSFLKGCIKVFIAATMGMRVVSLVPFLQDFTSQILMSSSLIVVVLGFVFQEGLTNIVHGFILSVFRPIRVGDRVQITVDGSQITGYVQSIELRHTVIRDVATNANVVIPNAKMDTCVIYNATLEKNACVTAFFDFSVTYESSLEKALALAEQLVARNMLVEKARKAMNDPEPSHALVRSLGESGIDIRILVMTLTAEESYQALSDLRRECKKRVDADPELDFAYPHIQVIS